MNRNRLDLFFHIFVLFSIKVIINADYLRHASNTYQQQPFDTIYFLNGEKQEILKIKPNHKRERPHKRIKKLLSNMLNESNERNRCINNTDIKIGMAYDSTFCKESCGEEETNAKLFDIIDHVSYMYQSNGICVRFVIILLDAYCDFPNDPYSQMFQSRIGQKAGSELLQDMEYHLKKRWKETPPKFGSFHLFSTREVYQDEKEAIGFATLKGHICRETGMDYAYNKATSKNKIFNYNLVAHELGHNFGMPHVNPVDREVFVMNGAIAPYVVRMSEATIEAINEKLRNSCS